MTDGLNIPEVTGVNGQTHGAAAIRNTIDQNAANKALINAVGGKTRKRSRASKKRKSKRTKRKSKSRRRKTKTRRKKSNKRRKSSRFRGTKKRGGSSDTIIVPTVPVPYTPTGTADQTPTGITSTLAGISTQGVANAEFDAHASSGGKKPRKKRQCKPGCACIMCKRYTKKK